MRAKVSYLVVLVILGLAVALALYDTYLHGGVPTWVITLVVPTLTAVVYNEYKRSKNGSGPDE